ncbi:putative MFS family arabinose efflux permease [Paraburkholderia fungorum]|uniref:MFS transporter n=1 Tax=Paraburkholderia fungorum TaxID=134537 RepID=UPI000D052CB7|nr:MFS transporter [Paraburkholderia fungorum]PRZ44967.1 putative MFS family arabinose efflux permease [Paraburkholderia fungorum]
MSNTTKQPFSWQPDRLTSRQIKYATWIAFLAWACAVYDFILFGTLLPQIGKSVGLSPVEQASLATWVAAGTVIVALAVGPLVDRFGRRFGMMFTVGGAGVCSALTAGAGMVSPLVLVIVRSLSGLGYAEQAVNGTYLSELYTASTDENLRRRRGFIYSLVQGGWPIGALTAAAMTALLLPVVGWKGCFIFAAVPSLIVAALASRLRESPQFEVGKRIQRLESEGQQEAARRLAREHGAEGHAAQRGFMNAFRGSARRATLALSAGHLLNWFAVQVFSVLGTTVLTSVHGVSFENSLLILFLSNAIAYAGYLTHGFFGDRFGRRNVIATGWTLGGLAFAAMLFGPHNVVVVVALYSLGQFFLIGPYSCLLFFVGESYDSGIRGTGSAIVNGLGPIGAIIASFGAATLLANHGNWQIAAFWFGAVPCALSGVAILFARKVPGSDPTADTTMKRAIA